MDKLTIILEELKQIREKASNDKKNNNIKADLNVLQNESECSDWYVRYVADKYGLTEKIEELKRTEDAREILIKELNSISIKKSNSF